MNKKIIKIDEEKCIGCGLCVNACNEGAIGMVDGKAKLLRDDYCDGLGNCLPVCPTNAISFEDSQVASNPMNPIERTACVKSTQFAEPSAENEGDTVLKSKTELKQWPVQIKLVPVNAPYFENAHLLVAADCAAYAYGNFHDEFMKKKITIIGCPKLDEGDYSEKLTTILKENNIKSVTVARMEVPCCGGLENAVKSALQNCGKLIQWKVVTLSTDGKIIED